MDETMRSEIASKFRWRNKLNAGTLLPMVWVGLLGISLFILCLFSINMMLVSREIQQIEVQVDSLRTRLDEIEEVLRDEIDARVAVDEQLREELLELKSKNSADDVSIEE